MRAVECKVSPDRVRWESLRVFRQAYPAGPNCLICPGISQPHSRRAGNLMTRVVGKAKVTVTDLDRLIRPEEFLREEKAGEQTKFIIEWSDASNDGCDCVCDGV